jgi:hypothetical protein
MKVQRKHWRPRHLFGAWCAYWVGLLLVKLGPAIAAGWRISQEANTHASANASFANDAISVTIIDAGRTTWAGSTTILQLVLLVAVPPLILWLIWMVGAARTNNADEPGALSDAKAGELHGPDSRTGIFDSSTSKREMREES